MKAATPLSAGLIFLLLFFVQGVFFIRANSPTYDEAMHLAAGYSYLATRDFRLEPQNPPLVKELLALPLFLVLRLPFDPDPKRWRDGIDYLVGQDFLYKSTLPADQMLFLSRLPNLFLGASLIALTGWWAYKLWGNRAAMMALALASLEPNLIAHSSLVTTDAGAALFIFLAIYLLWEYLRSPDWRLVVLIGCASGAALTSKFSGVLVIPMIVSIVGLSSFLVGGRRSLAVQTKQRSYEALKTGAMLLLVIVVALLMIPLAYFFEGAHLWLAGFERFLKLGRLGQPAFFWGEYSYQGWWSYFPVAFLIKTPIGSLMLIFASLVLYRAGTRLESREAICLLVPVAVVLVAMAQAKVNIGVRHILPVYPFLFVCASRLATVHAGRPWLPTLLIGMPFIVTVVSSLRIAPHQLAYFNEMVGGPSHGYRYLSDSNLDWGQDLKGVKAYMDKEKIPIVYLSYFGTAPPSYYGIRYQYVPGAWPLEWPPTSDKVPADADRKILAISVCNLQDVSTAYDPLFRWLWLRQPVAKIGYSIFVYDLTDDREGLTKLEEAYIKSGIGPFP